MASGKRDAFDQRIESKADALNTHKMVGVVEHDLAANTLELLWSDTLQSALSTDGHEDWCVDWTVGQS